MTASQILSAIAPQFDTDTNRATHIQLAVLRTSTTCFGDKYEYAVALRAAHTLTLSNLASSGVSSGGSGGITSKREGDLSISFGGTSSTGVSGDLGQTSYGVELQNLIDGNILGIRITGLNVKCE